MSRIKPMYDNIRLNMTVVSDTHIDIKHPMPWLPKLLLKQTLKQSQQSAVRPDVYLTVGDTTSRGSGINWKMAKECFSKYDPADNVLLTVGNHDCWNDDGFDKALANYLANFKDVCGFALDRPYFSKVIKGYHLIFLGNDADAGCEANIGDEQFEWFCNEMKAGGESGKPIFVFCHQSLNQKHGLPRTWDRHEKPDRDPWEGGIGTRSDEIENEMKKYKNVLYFSGHSHMGYVSEERTAKEGYSNFEQDGSVTLINLPSLSCGNHHGDDNRTGWGMMVETYDDRILLRPRYFRGKSWNEKVKIQDGRPYYEIKLEK